MEQFEITAMIAKVAAVVLVLLHVVPIMVWVERRGSALMQNRRGPNRVGPLGLFQSIADVVKFMFKEDFIPGHVTEKLIFIIAPAILLIPAFMTFAVIPFGGEIKIGEYLVSLRISDLDVGILYIFSIASLGIYGIIMAGWSSNNKYSLLGSLRSSAQMISYEISLGMSILGLVMTSGSLDLNDIVKNQSQVLLSLGGLEISKWGFLTQPLGFVIFLTAAYAETNRLPFDLPEGESEIVGGYHTEYGSMKFALFFMAEYINMTVASAMITTLFFGGYLLLPGMSLLIDPIANALTGWSHIAVPQELATTILQVVSFAIKTIFFMWLFVWVRWTLPRFRYDQLMDLGWKVMIPLSLLNVVLTAFAMYFFK